LPGSAQFDNLQVVLVAARNPLNIGAAARAMSNFGFRRLRVARPFEPSFREARSAVGASQLLASAQEFGSVAEAVADCSLVVGTTAVRHRALHHPLHRLEFGTKRIRKQLQAGRVALLFGSEKFGLSNEDLSHCQWLMRIPTCEANISMNLGQAVAVCLYELIREAKTAAAAEKSKPAPAKDLERFTLAVIEAMRQSGYLDRRPIRDVEDRVRRLVRRLRIPADDTIAWLGILRQIVWKLAEGDRK
jgi:tRNA/rRNA methyltransferase